MATEKKMTEWEETLEKYNDKYGNVDDIDIDSTVTSDSLNDKFEDKITFSVLAEEEGEDDVIIFGTIQKGYDNDQNDEEELSVAFSVNKYQAVNIAKTLIKLSKLIKKPGMTDKKTRTPRTVESITAGALALPLFERVDLCKKLKESILEEVADKEERAKTAATLIKDL